MNINSIGIIGGGPSGIAALYELLHTLKDGTSIVGRSLRDEEELAFSDVVLFERNSTIGGTWAKSEAAKIGREPNLPELHNENYDKPQYCFEKKPIPDELNSSHNYTNPYIRPTRRVQQWKSSGVYDGLFTNIPYNLMSFSFTKDQQLPDRLLKTLQPWEEVSEYLESVVEENEMDKYIRYDNNVEKIYKTGTKWTVVVCVSNEDGDQWYQQQFDALIIANGRTVPYIPVIPNMSQFNDEHPGLMQHCKNISHPQSLLHKRKVLFIGSGISTVDLIQYCYPRPLNTVFISRRSLSADFDWVNHAAYSAGIVNKPEIKQFIPGSDLVEFMDGSVESGFDSIILGTGYHRYYPFLEQFETDSQRDYHDFFMHVFSKCDPTLALVGTIYTAFFFNRAEANAAAIAGVWSGLTKLPSAEEQSAAKESEKYAVWDIKSKYIDKLIDNYGTKGRPNPFESPSRLDPVRDYGEGFRIVGQIFSDLKQGNIIHDDIFNIEYKGVY